MNETNWSDADCFEDWTLTENEGAQNLQKLVKQLESKIANLEINKAELLELMKENRQCKDAPNEKPKLICNLCCEGGSANGWRNRQNRAQNQGFRHAFEGNKRRNRKNKQKNKENNQEVDQKKREVKVF